VGVSRAGDTIVSGSWDATIKVWDTAQGALLRSLHCGVGNALHCLDWNHSHHRSSQAVCESGAGGDPRAAAQAEAQAAVTAVVNAGVTPLPPAPATAREGESGGGDWVGVGCRQRQVMVWDVEVGACVARLHGHLKVGTCSEGWNRVCV